MLPTVVINVGTERKAVIRVHAAQSSAAMQSLRREVLFMVCTSFRLFISPKAQIAFALPLHRGDIKDIIQ